MSTPNFGGGYLKDGERVCRRCFARIVKVQPQFGLRSRKDFTTASIQEILNLKPVHEEAATTTGRQSVAESQERTDDPVPFFLNALTTGKDKEEALASAHRAHEMWWAIDVSDRDLSMQEQMELLDLRSLVYAGITTVCIWNGEFEIAAKLEREFLGNEALWRGHRRETMELYLVHLIFQKQWKWIERIFEDNAFKAAFLDYYDLYRSVLDMNYEFQSDQDPFLATVNKVNHYCMQIGRPRLFGEL